MLLLPLGSFNIKMTVMLVVMSMIAVRLLSSYLLDGSLNPLVLLFDSHQRVSQQTGVSTAPPAGSSNCCCESAVILWDGFMVAAVRP